MHHKPNGFIILTDDSKWRVHHETQKDFTCLNKVDVHGHSNKQELPEANHRARRSAQGKT